MEYLDWRESARTNKETRQDIQFCDMNVKVAADDEADTNAK